MKHLSNQQQSFLPQQQQQHTTVSVTSGGIKKSQNKLTRNIELSSQMIEFVGYQLGCVDQIRPELKALITNQQRQKRQVPTQSSPKYDMITKLKVYTPKASNNNNMNTCKPSPQITKSALSGEKSGLGSQLYKMNLDYILNKSV